MKKLVVFASGDRRGGGSGFERLVEASRNGRLTAHIVAVVSNHADGGVKHRADRLCVPFILMSGPWEADLYQRAVSYVGAHFVALSGWLKPVRGLSARRTINIHPGPLPRLGGKGMYGMKVHRAVMDAYRTGDIAESAVTMHFVTDEYDEGPVFFRKDIPIYRDDTPESLAQRVNAAEHRWQSWATNLVVRGEISWDGQDPKSLVVPAGYMFL